MQFHNNSSVGVIGETKHWDFNLQSFMAANLTINTGGTCGTRLGRGGARSTGMVSTAKRA